MRFSSGPLPGRRAPVPLSSYRWCQSRVVKLHFCDAEGHEGGALTNLVDSCTVCDACLQSHRMWWYPNGLQVLESVVKYRWNVLPAEQREGIKNYISELIVQVSFPFHTKRWPPNRQGAFFWFRAQASSPDLADDILARPGRQGRSVSWYHVQHSVIKPYRSTKSP